MNNLILGTRVDELNIQDVLDRCLAWAFKGESRYVCAANVHMIMEGYDDPEFRLKVNRADLVVSDGMPLVWTLRRRGWVRKERVYGPDLTLQLLAAADKAQIPVGLLGGTPDTLDRLVHTVRDSFPGLVLAFSASPPFRPLTDEEDRLMIQDINASGARLLFVGLGCPRQEKWMASHAGKVQAVMLGVGAAFDFIAGTRPQAPHWMRSAGLEWLFRLGSEPGRLWRRYLYNNPRFLFLALLPALAGRAP